MPLVILRLLIGRYFPDRGRIFFKCCWNGQTATVGPALITTNFLEVNEDVVFEVHNCDKRLKSKSELSLRYINHHDNTETTGTCKLVVDLNKPIAQEKCRFQTCNLLTPDQSPELDVCIILEALFPRRVACFINDCQSQLLTTLDVNELDQTCQEHAEKRLSNDPLSDSHSLLKTSKLIQNNKDNVSSYSDSDSDISSKSSEERNWMKNERSLNSSGSSDSGVISFNKLNTPPIPYEIEDPQSPFSPCPSTSNETVERESDGSVLFPCYSPKQNQSSFFANEPAVSNPTKNPRVLAVPNEPINTYRTSTDIESDSDPAIFECNVSPVIKTKPSSTFHDESYLSRKRKPPMNEHITSTTKKAAYATHISRSPINEKIMVLAFDNAKKPLLAVDNRLAVKMKPYQQQGVRFMWEACFVSLERASLPCTRFGYGCILAHSMGLGKTFQVISLVHTLFADERLKVRRILVVCPLSLVLNWVSEFEKWLTNDLAIPIYEFASLKADWKMRALFLRNWLNRGGVMVVNYDIYRSLTRYKASANATEDKSSLRIWKTLKQALINPGPDLLICDEGHILRKDTSQLFQNMNRIATKRRILLTGTPLQNNLLEYYNMIEFIKPGFLGSKEEFHEEFVNPISQGQNSDSTPKEVELMKHRTFILHERLGSIVQRFDYSVLVPYLPPKWEYVVMVKLTDLQRMLYNHYIETYSRAKKSLTLNSSSALFVDHRELSLIWSHPKALLWSESSPVAADRDEYPPSSSDTSEEEIKDRSANRKRRSQTVDRTQHKKPMQAPVPWWADLVGQNETDLLDRGGKMAVLFEIIRLSERAGDKLLVFSRSLVVLDVIEYYLNLEDTNRQSSGNPCRWRVNEDYFRLDGSTSPEMRMKWCDEFNDRDNHMARLFLLSTKTGGQGLNLTSANRVVLFDVSWNPNDDLQSIFRIYRYGQKEPCFIYKLVAFNTMEEMIYKRQISKLSLAHRVVDDKQVERMFTKDELADLYSISNLRNRVREEENIRLEDTVLAQIKFNGCPWIESIQQHNSILESQEDEGLTEGERIAAYRAFNKFK